MKPYAQQLFPDDIHPGTYGNRTHSPYVVNKNHQRKYHTTALPHNQTDTHTTQEVGATVRWAALSRRHCRRKKPPGTLLDVNTRSRQCLHFSSKRTHIHSNTLKWHSKFIQYKTKYTDYQLKNKESTADWNNHPEKVELRLNNNPRFVILKCNSRCVQQKKT